MSSCGSSSRCVRWRPTVSFRAFQHEGFWQPMDTLRDRRELQELWDSGAGSLADMG